MQALTAVKKEGYLKLNKMRCLIFQKETMDVWTEIYTESIFQDFKLQSNQGNDIWLELDLSLALKAIQSCLQAPSVIMRLTKKNDHPYLSIETRTHFNVIDQQVDLKQDIPCRVLGSNSSSSLQAPASAQSRVSICLPPIKELKPVVDRMKTITESVTLSATMARTLAFRADTDAIQLITFFKDLPNTIDDKNLTPNPNEKEDARISTKLLSKILASHCINMIHIMLSFCDKHLQFHVFTDGKERPFYITYYVPRENN